MNKRNGFEKVLKGFAPLAGLLVIALILTQTALAKATYDLVIHYLYPTVSAQGNGYDVEVYFSILDEEGKFQKGFEIDDFTLIEDGAEQAIESLDQVKDQPLNVVVVLDVSVPSQRLTNEKDAVTDFINDLERDDAVGILRFDGEIETVANITTDHDEAVDKLKKVKYVPEGDNCLYDAMYRAVKMMAKQPPGRRAIVVLTDASDKMYNSTKSCSANTADDVIDLATSWNTRVPIYTLGIAEAVDEKALKRISERTGGRYKYAKNSGDIAAQLNDISYQFQNEYIIRYISQAMQGEHTLVLEVERKGSHDEDTYIVIFPERLAGGEQPLVPLSSPTAEKETMPITQVDQVQPTEEVFLPTPIVKEDRGFSLSGDSLLWVVLGVVGVFGIGLIILAVVLFKRSSKPHAKSHPSPAPSVPSPAVQPMGLDATFDGFIPSQGMPHTSLPVGTLTVLASDDPAMVGKVLMIGAGRTTIGRSADNDIVLPQDKGVSRQHVVLELLEQEIYIAEAVSAEGKRPTYGAYVNEQRLGTVPQKLPHGAEIRLGNRCRMRFEQLMVSASSGEDKTMDLSSGDDVTRADMDDDRTIAFNGS